MGKIARPKKLAIYSELRPRQSRSRNGCMECRARRKKCDENCPVCGSCQKLGENCSWPPVSKSAERSSAANRESTQWSEGTNPGTLEPCSLEGASLSISQREVSVHVGQLDAGANPQVQSNRSGGSRVSAFEMHALGMYAPPSEMVPHSSGSPVDLDTGILNDEADSASMLFDHFCHNTIPWLLNSDDHDQLLVKYVVPLAIADTLVLQTVLALSGIHLRRVMPAIEEVALKYYTTVLSELNQVLSEPSRIKSKDYRTIFTTIILLCHYEFIDGGTYGAALQHVKACRGFIGTALQHLDDPDHRELVVLLVESYGYFALVANLASSSCEEHIRLGIEFSTSIMPRIKNMPSFGSMFVYEPEEISLVPLIARFSKQTQKDPSAAVGQQYWSIYTTLQNSIRSREPLLESLECDPAGLASLSKAQFIKDVKTNSLLILLQASLYQCYEGPVETAELLRPLVNRTIQLLRLVQASDRDYGLFWCFMVVGSFLRDQETQKSLIEQLEMIQARTPSQKKGIHLLRCLWRHSGRKAYGLVGLEDLARELGINSFIC